MKCNQNIGRTDKIIRLIIAFIVIYLGFTVNHWFYLLSALIIIEAIIGHCPLYSLLKINTKEKDEKESKTEKEDLDTNNN